METREKSGSNSNIAKRHGNVVRTHDVIGVTVKNRNKDTLGEIKELMLDKLSGRVAYVVLNAGSFLGLGGKLHALPWHSISYDPNEECFILDVDKQKLSGAPSFNENEWPNMEDKTWGESVSKYYGVKSYWE